MKRGIIIQARMSSRRLPGKVLKSVCGKPILQYLIERLERYHSLGPIVIATSTDSADTPIVDFCQEQGSACYRGTLQDVAGRFKDILDAYRFDFFVRISGDSPLLDPSLIEKAVDLFHQGDTDLVTNVHPKTFPKGQSVEVIRAETFRNAYSFMKDEEDLEHVTKYFYRNAEDFNILNFTSGLEYGDMNLSVDTAEDFESFKAIVGRMVKPHWAYTFEEIVELYREVKQNQTLDFRP